MRRQFNEVREALNATGLPHTITAGKKHYKIKIEGRLVGILPRSPRDTIACRAHLNTLAQIKRFGRNRTSV